MRKSVERNYGEIFENIVVWSVRSWFYSAVVALRLSSLAPHACLLDQQECVKVVCWSNDYNFRNFNYSSVSTFCFFNPLHILVAAFFAFNPSPLHFHFVSFFTLVFIVAAPKSCTVKAFHVPRFCARLPRPLAHSSSASIGHHAIRRSHCQSTICASATCTFVSSVQTAHNIHINALLSSFIVSWGTI